jgi:hypothetical protein
MATSSAVPQRLLDFESGSSAMADSSDEFKERIYADLDTLRSSPVGLQMLSSLDESHEDTKAIAADWPILGGPAYGGDVVTIREFTEENGGASERGVDWLFNDLDIQINPAYPGGHEGGVPITVLQHELGHAWDYTHDTIDRDTYDGVDPIDTGDVSVAERQATGLPIDHDDDPDTPEIIDPDHPYTYTENGLRDEMRRPHRDTYG